MDWATLLLALASVFFDKFTLLGNVLLDILGLLMAVSLSMFWVLRGINSTPRREEAIVRGIVDSTIRVHFDVSGKTRLCDCSHSLRRCFTSRRVGTFVFSFQFTFVTADLQNSRFSGKDGIYFILW